MKDISIIGIDLSKRSFELHGATAEGAVVFRKRLSRGKLLAFLEDQPSCWIVMEACGGAHFWGREIQALGHECALIPPMYVKPFRKRQKNDANDAAAIVEAAQRPTMRFVAVKSEEAQADAAVFRTRGLLVRQRTQLVNALRGQLTEFGIVAARGLAKVEELRQEMEQAKSRLPEGVVRAVELLCGQIDGLTDEIKALDREITERARRQEDLKRLMTIPGVGPICAMAVCAFAPPMETFRCGRDFAAWVGLTPRQHSTGGKQRLGRITKMGQRDLRQLLVPGATAVLRQQRTKRTGIDPWIARMLAEKPPKLVAVALANRMARVLWAISVRKEDYRANATAA